LLAPKRRITLWVNDISVLQTFCMGCPCSDSLGMNAIPRFFFDWSIFRRGLSKTDVLLFVLRFSTVALRYGVGESSIFHTHTLSHHSLIDSKECCIAALFFFIAVML
jgi:hypothetical protein